MHEFVMIVDEVALAVEYLSPIQKAPASVSTSIMYLPGGRQMGFGFMF
jgi:hypothetical protein